MSIAIINNRIRVMDPTDEMYRWAHVNLVLDNPDYYKRLRMNKWLGNTPEYIYLYETVGSELWLPFGTITDFYRQFHDQCTFQIAIAEKRKVRYESNIELYDYQAEAVEVALGKKNGVIVMPCGSGKTQTALEIVSRIGGRCLWLTHTYDLLNQSMSRAKSVLITSAKYGKITAGKVDIGEGITFATVQTLSKLDLSQYKSTWDVIIVDECQHCCGSPTKVTQFYKVVNSLSSRYKFGLTATPKRADGLERAMFALLGNVICRITKDQVESTTCPVKVEFIETGYIPDYNAVLLGDGTIDYSRLVDDLTHDRERMELVGDKVEECAKDGATLVLANRVEYLKTLREYVDTVRSVCLSGAGNSKAAKAERKEALRKLNCGELDCVFATYALAREGLDIPNLRYVVFTTPEKDPTTIEQSTGRVGRKADGKEYGTVVDFVDNFGMYKGWAKKRAGYYKKLDAIY